MKAAYMLSHHFRIGCEVLEGLKESVQVALLDLVLPHHFEPML